MTYQYLLINIVEEFFPPQSILLNNLLFEIKIDWARYPLHSAAAQVSLAMKTYFPGLGINQGQRQFSKSL